MTDWKHLEGAPLTWQYRIVNGVCEFRTAPAETPTDDERDGLAKAMCAIETRSKSATLEEVQAGIQRWTRHRHEADRLIEELADYGLSIRRSVVPEPSAEGYAEFEGWEQEMFRHQPVLSMADGSIAGCQCLDRVFTKGKEDWGTHLASVMTLNDWTSDYIARVRTGLRAASAVTEQGENR